VEEVLSVTSEQRKRGFEVVNRALSLDPEFAHYFEEVYNTHTHKNETKLKEGFEENGKSCENGVPAGFKNIQFSPSNKGKKKRPAKERFPFACQLLTDGIISEKALLYALKAQLERRPIVIATDEKGEMYIFYGKVKGCEKYNLDLKNKLLRASKKLIQEMKALYLLTITCDTKIYGEDRLNATKVFREDCNKTLRALKRKYGAKYVAVIEFTKNGYPHMHVLLGLPYWAERYDIKRQNGSVIKSGRLHSFIKKRSKSKVFCLQKAGGKGLQYYLTKYLAKDLDKLKDLAENPERKLTKEERKTLLTNVMPILADIRQISYSKFDYDTYDNIEDKELDKLISEVEEYAKLGKIFPKGKIALILLLTKLTATCCSGAYIASGVGTKPKFEYRMGYHSSIFKEDWKVLNTECRSLGCNGCIYSNMVRNACHNFPVELKTTSEYQLDIHKEFLEKKKAV